MNLRLANYVAGACFLFLGLGSAHADFMKDPNPTGAKLYIDQANKNVNAFTGHVGVNAVDMTSVQNVDTGGGFANINPVHRSILSSVTFTPVNPNLFEKFSFRGQLVDPGDVTIEVLDQNLQSFIFHILSPDANFGRIGIKAVPGSGETIKSVTILSDGFKEAKQMEFGLVRGENPVPEPTSVLLMGSGLAALAVVTKRKNAPKA